MQLIHVREPRDVFEEVVRNAIIPSDTDAQVPDVVSGTLFWHWKRLEPSVHIPRTEGDGVEEVSPAGLNPRSGYESAGSERLKV